MNIIEIIMLIGGIAVFIASYFVGNKKDSGSVAVHVDAELSEEDKIKIQNQVDSIIKDKIDNVSEQAEAQMDKISNTKMLELNDYAETIMSEINRNHNETVFLYDMLNEKAKEVKNTVKDVNIAKKEVDSIQMHNRKALEADKSISLSAEVSADKELLKEPVKPAETKSYGYKKSTPSGSKDLAKERLMELVRKSNEKARVQVTVDSAGIKEQINIPDAASVENTEDMAKKDSKARKTPEKKPASEKQPSTKSSSAKETAAKPSSAKSSAKSSSAKSSSTKSSASKSAASKSPAVKAEDIAADFPADMANNDRIIELSKRGVSNKDIAKLLNIGVGEVKLVVDLFNSSK